MKIFDTEKEPVLALGGLTLVSLTAFAVALVGLGRAFGMWEISGDQEAQITQFLTAAWALAIPLAVVIRSKVYSPNTVSNIKETLVQADPSTPLTETEAAALAK